MSDKKDANCSADTDTDEEIPLAKLRHFEGIDDIPLSELRSRKFLSTPKSDTTNNDTNHSLVEDFIYDSDADPEFQLGKCEVEGCAEDVWSACETCSILVCFDHCNEDVEFCSEHGQILSKRLQERNYQVEVPESNHDKEQEQGNSILDNDNTEGHDTFDTTEHGLILSNQPQDRNSQEEVPEEKESRPGNELEQRNTPGNENTEGHDTFNTTGKRKRATPSERRKKQKQMKTEKERKKYKVREGCGSTCRRVTKCNEKITEEDQRSINAHYLSLDYGGRKEFVYQSITKEECKRRTTQSKKKNWSYQYTLKTHTGMRTQVCRSFFLGTLGMHPKNDWTVTHLLRNSPVTSQSHDQHFADGRGGKKVRKYDHEEVIAHIEKYNPTISHYRSAHAPYRRYLPIEVTVRAMHEEFKKEKQSEMSYDTFNQIFKSMNISMATLGHEECEICETHELHMKICTCETTCEISQAYRSHKDKYTKARIEYQKDSHSQHGRDEIFLSADLQKVIMLPQMECFKEAIFTRRLTVFNETFAELGSGKRDYAVLWHEAISGRQDEDLASTFHEYLLKMRDMERVVIWLDNCGAQNKNWSLYTMLAYLVNSETVQMKNIELKYLEKGHTFMAADAKHKQIQQQMRGKGKVYDFEDFQACVSKARCEVIAMPFSSFREWKSGMSPYALKKLQNRPYLEKMVHVKFIRGSDEIYFRNSFDDEFDHVKFLKASFELKCDLPRTCERGIPAKKKEDIIKKLIPLMPKNRHQFWESLPVNDKVKDLSVEQERRTSL